MTAAIVLRRRTSQPVLCCNPLPRRDAGHSLDALPHPKTYMRILIAMRAIHSLIFSALLLGGFAASSIAATEQAAAPRIAVAPQYSTTHVYVAPEDFDRFTDSLIATFGGHKSQQGVFQVTPTPSQTMSQLVFTPVGTLSVFGFKTPIPYPFGIERTGYLVTDMDAAVKSAKAHGADAVVATFPDPIGSDAIIEWPGGVHMQLYWHTQKPQYDPLQTVPENRVYLSPQRADAFIGGFVAFAHGRVVSDERKAPGIEIGRAKESYRRVRLESPFGKLAVMVTDGHLPYPFGREVTGYEVGDLAATLRKAQAAGAAILVQPFVSDKREAAIVQFPGGYIAEIHAAVR
ncbi:glyoxalase [Chromobacterium sphagni]|nr:glyoxalase [Chromobacterium sphagni]